MTSCFILIFLCSLLCGRNVLAVNASAKTKTSISYDSSKVITRSISEAQQKELLNNKDYQYDKIGPAPKTLWERFTEWFWRKVAELFDSKAGSIGFRIFQYALIVATIVLIILLLLKNNIRALFYGKSASIPIDFKEFEEDIHAINFEELISQAIAKKDFKRAVRLHFLKLLKELTDSNLIVWKIDKTNNDYSVELSNSKHSRHFKELATLYEYIWYGDFHLDEKNFSNAISKFKEFKLTN